MSELGWSIETPIKINNLLMLLTFPPDLDDIRGGGGVSRGMLAHLAVGRSFNYGLVFCLKSRPLCRWKPVGTQACNQVHFNANAVFGIETTGWQIFKLFGNRAKKVYQMDQAPKEARVITYYLSQLPLSECEPKVVPFLMEYMSSKTFYI